MAVRGGARHEARCPLIQAIWAGSVAGCHCVNILLLGRSQGDGVVGIDDGRGSGDCAEKKTLSVRHFYCCVIIVEFIDGLHPNCPSCMLLTV